MTHTLKLPRWEDFEAAFIIGSPDARYFVHLETGEVQYTGHMDGDWVRERVIKRTQGEGWLEIPRAGADVGEQEITRFIEEEPDEELRADFEQAMAEGNKFIAFRRALTKHRAARDRWAQIRQEGIEQRLYAFCEEHDIVVDGDEYRAIAERLGADA